MKKLGIWASITAMLVLSGCATHGVVTIPVKPAVENVVFTDKSIATELYYSQPKPGVFSSGEVLPMKPIKDAELSVGSSRVLSRFNEIMYKQLPINTKIDNHGESDLIFITKLQAKDKLGPAYADFDAALSFGKGLLTLGLGSKEYTIVADFDVTYELQDKSGTVLLEETYEVHDEIDHERGGYEGWDVGENLAEKLLEKHIVITMNEYFTKLSEMKL